MWLIVLIIAIVIIIGLIILFSSNKTANYDVEDYDIEDYDIEVYDDMEYSLDDSQYRQYVYRTIQEDFKPYLQQILDAIDQIRILEEQNSKELNQAAYNAMVEVYNKADSIEQKIIDYWNSNQFDKDFSFYIGLHYASHLLGNTIKQEQQIIKNSFVECKNQQKKWGDQIENLKYRKQRASGKRKAEISQEIGECCKAHKRISTLASQIGATNTQYNQRVSQQHIETAKRRDFIAANFGERGRRWKERMHQRALKRKGV